MRIYIIDDCKSELMCWQRTLEMHTDWEYRLCNTFESLNNALAEGTPPDVILIDYIMPFTPGTKVNDYIRKYYPDIPKIICSGKDEPEYQILAAQSGAGFISKKLPFQHRLEVIRGYVNQS